MDKFLVMGPCKLKGQVSISGSKNAALPILASTLLFDKPVVIENLPQVRDIDTMLNLLKSLGSKIQLSKNKKTVKIYKTKKKKIFCILLPYENDEGRDISFRTLNCKISKIYNIITRRMHNWCKACELSLKCTSKTWNEI